MTDLERAQWAIRGEPETWIPMIVMHLAAARREGAEEMREQAARVCEGSYTTGSMRSTLTAIAAAIRALKEQ